MLFTGIDHPAIACYDVQKLTDWYCATFGMRVIGTNGKTPPSLMLGYGDSLSGPAMLETMPAREPGPKPAETNRFCAGLRHMAIRVSNFDKAYDHLKKAGIEFLGEPVIAVGGGRIVSFRDPEGNELQIVER
jgi:glyoxylase I family protein